ncbi:hypothetical protein M501DRAFT_1019993 [Patellaria atrata CBS 101060]|uniref:Zn(2)-C6 fungal-type domain-containing protein n=1 Tax=Patellaria atrata CBS 101060 TaxID=1346257 RepID=A0A9P4VMI6_9PEZI|nr:hypothetical protein M501DRAFT_1019993 [Patellaria atrata CBS 101060]
MSDYRPLRPAATQSSSERQASISSDNTDQGSIQNESTAGKCSKRVRKAPAHVSQNACTNCKKARAKCEGHEPQPCARCVARKTADTCIYEVHTRQAKEEMLRRIKDLEQKNTSLQGSLREKEQWIESFVKTLREREESHGQTQELSYKNIVNWLGRPPLKKTLPESPFLEKPFLEKPFLDKSADQSRASDREPSIKKQREPPLSYFSDLNMDGKDQWTMVTPNKQLVHHLMALYFTWIYPTHMLFSEKHFMSSFGDKDQQYCTSAMVNVMCAMGCTLLVDQGGDAIDREALGMRFTEEAQLEITKENIQSLTYSTTYAILFLVELSSGQARKAASHLRLAVESLQEVDRDRYSTEAVEITSWGIHTLNTAWAAFTYQKPAAPISPHALVFSNVSMDQKDAYWQPYRFPSDNALQEVQSHAIETAKHYATLNQVIHETINIYCGSRNRVSGRSIIDLYRRYINWEATLPPALAMDDPSNTESLPHIYFLHMVYQVALCHLFRPLVKSKHMSPQSIAHLRNLILESAQKGLRIFQRSRQLFSNRYQTPFQAFCIVHLCETILAIGNERRGEREAVIRLCLESLGEALEGFHFVGALQAMFCQTVEDLNLELPENLSELMRGRTEYGPEELLDACERVTYAQPVDILLGRLDASISEQLEHNWQRFIENRGSGSGAEELEDSLMRSQESSPARASVEIQQLLNDTR